jgi:hypothetical protein
MPQENGAYTSAWRLTTVQCVALILQRIAFEMAGSACARLFDCKKVFGRGLVQARPNILRNPTVVRFEHSPGLLVILWLIGPVFFFRLDCECAQGAALRDTSARDGKNAAL